MNIPKRLQHLSHIEDLMFDHGVEGLHATCELLQTLINMHSQAISVAMPPLRCKIKMDGSPSVIAGYAPDTNEFFVGLKSALNNPKKRFTRDTIKFAVKEYEYHVVRVLEACLDLEYVFKTGIIQGDVMHYRYAYSAVMNPFTPNVISYTDPNLVEPQHDKHSMGIVFHTSYEGDAWESLIPNFNPTVVLEPKSELNQHITVYDNTYVPFVDMQHPNAWMLQSAETELNVARRFMHATMSQSVESVVAIPRFGELMKKYVNHRVRNSLHPVHQPDPVGDVVRFFEAQNQLHVDEAKSERTKSTRRNVMRETTAKLEMHHTTLFHMLVIYDAFNAVKLKILGVVPETTATLKLKPSYRIHNEHQPCSHEGLVVYDADNQWLVKLVNRAEFSKRNFDKHDGAA